MPTFILLPDDLFGGALKYLSVLHEDRRVVFIPPAFDVGNFPGGFVHGPRLQLLRSAELLSDGLDFVSFVVCAESGFSIPLVGRDAHKLTISSGIGFDDCLDFFSAHGYHCVDVVLGPGEFCVRGGILDVYPFSSTAPVRISFLDDFVEVRKFDIQSQLTSDIIKHFSIVAPGKQDLLPLKGCSLSDFLCLFYSPDNTLNIGGAHPVGFSEAFSCVTFEGFLQRGGSPLAGVHVDDALSSVGVKTSAGDLIVPPWFINAPPTVVESADGGDYIPLNITNIHKGDYLVHRDHGVGVSMGLSGHGGVQEVLSIKYEDGGIIRLDAGHLDLVDFYAPSDADGVKVDSLQKRSLWSRKRRAALRCAEETIEYLLNLYVRRNDISREPFLAYVDIERQFLADFQYKDTEDQALAWKEISADLSSPSPMDRLLCGDVGFGKTELALRASFRVVLGGRRVMVLAPTTILARQLYSSFLARLGPYAVNVDFVSRFRSPKKIKLVQENIVSEKNDVLIGTHSVLNNDIYLENIGLLVVDEEHRFGVGHKEKVRRFKEGVDVLSMSATPIPRSLNLALSGIYSISLLQSPPLMRLPIITRVDYFNDELIHEAISFEVGRGGQVYFVHNNIQSIREITARLGGLFSDLNIIFIHGQEPSRDIEKKMSLFVSGSVHVLVCTSIIEAGIDVPNANCIIINNSQLFGLSQLYQIRGRVGRGYRRAYAYLLIPRGLNLSNKAFGRIKTIEKNTRLGSGYNISKSDLELRGSGSLFGYKQSGGGGSVGYEMYLRLVRRAIHKSGRLKTGFIVLPEDVLIEIFKSRHIPENYISHGGLRLSFYKSFSSATSGDEIDNVLYHLTDRFGTPPLSVNNLIKECRLRLLAASAGVLSIQTRGCGLVCQMIQNDDVKFITAVLELFDVFFRGEGVDFHLLSSQNPGLGVCIHVSNTTDKYSLLSKLLDKFIVLNCVSIGGL